MNKNNNKYLLQIAINIKNTVNINNLLNKGWRIDNTLALTESTPICLQEDYELYKDYSLYSGDYKEGHILGDIRHILLSIMNFNIKSEIYALLSKNIDAPLTECVECGAEISVIEGELFDFNECIIDMVDMVDNKVIEVDGNFFEVPFKKCNNCCRLGQKTARRDN